MKSKTSFQGVAWLFCLGSLAFLPPVFGQTPFLRTGQVFQIRQNTNELEVFTVQPSYNSISYSTLGQLPPGGFDALGFRRSDNLLYGIAIANNHLFKVGQNADFLDLGIIGLQNNLYYLAGDITPDGRYLFSVGSDATGTDIHLAKTDLETAGFPTQIIPLSGTAHLADIAFDPSNGRLFGFDQGNARVVTINPDNGFAYALQNLEPENTIYGLYFDAFGDMYGVGHSLFGVVDALFKVNKTTGKETRLTTGALSTIADIASCPFSVELKSETDPGVNLPCTAITYTFSLANGSGETITGLEFLQSIPPGFHFSGVLQNTFGVLVDTMSVPGSLRMQNLTLTSGIRYLTVKLAVGDVPSGKYFTQAVVKNLPPQYGLTCLSDYTKQPGFEDSTVFLVNRFEADSLDFFWLICQGERLVLETTAYGDNIVWNNGAFDQNREVSQGGFYSFVAGSTCEEIVVNHEVTSTACPFTIEVMHLFRPDTSFACSDVLFRFILSNDSGEPRLNLSFADTLPVGFSFVDVVKNPFGGVLKPNLAGNIFCLQDMTLKEGVDTLDIRVHVGDVPPGRYKNRAVLMGLPTLMGPIRLSDNPLTSAIDSSVIQILGTLSDSLVLEETICANAEITLDAKDLGQSFRWENGSTAPRLVIQAPGTYQLTVFDGCEPVQVFWNVTPGLAINIAPIGPFQIHQGESAHWLTQVNNQGDSLDIRWTDPLVNSLSCLTCLDLQAMPLHSTVYGLRVANEVCFDTTDVIVEVDETRRIFAPNIFSPNDDGKNDTFFLQSPDFGQVRVLNIHDRWGNLVFQSRNTMIQDDANAWDGWHQNQPAPAGVYVWWASLEFVDGQRQIFTGDVTIVR